MLPRSVVYVTFAAMASHATTTSSGDEVRDIQDFIRSGPGITVFLIGAAILVAILLIIAKISQRALEHFVDQEGTEA